MGIPSLNIGLKIKFDFPFLSEPTRQKTPTEFLLCPQNNQERTLESYLNNLIKGKVFTRTQYGDGGVVLDSGYNEEEKSIYVLTQKDGAIKPRALKKSS